MEVAVIPVTAFQQNCSIIRCEQTKKAAVIDPGGDIDRILTYLSEEGIEVEKILLTHGHIDHAGGTKKLRDELRVKVIGPHHEDAFLLESLAEQGRAFGLGAAEPVTPDEWLEDGQEVTVGALRFEVRHCPGHTPGHVVFYNAENQLVIVGDVLFDGSIGRTDFPRGDHATLMQSIKEKLLSLPDDTTFLPGHGPTSTIGRQRGRNPFLQGL